MAIVIPIVITKDANEFDWVTVWDKHTSYDSVTGVAIGQGTLWNGISIGWGQCRNAPTYDAYTDVAITIDDTQDEFNSWTQDIIEKSDSIIGQQRLWRQ